MYQRKRKRHIKPCIAALFIVIVIAGTVLLFYKNGHLLGTHTESIVSTSHNSKGSGGTAAPSSSSSSAAVSVIQPVQVSLQNAAKPLWIHVSIAKQIVTVYDANDRVVESWLCSTGSPGYDTPKGTFHVYNRGKSFFSKKYQEGAYYWVAFYEDYYFHSVPYDKDKQIIQSVANDLGRQDSHGCVHLSIENSQWIYDNISNGTKVVIE
jgi:hypothetical protein